jgi:hypothetical protein
MLFVAVTHLVEGLSLEALLTLKVEKSVNLFTGYTAEDDLNNQHRQKLKAYVIISV